MKQALAAITLCILALGVSPGTVLAGPDEYIGDAGIYTLAGGSVGVKPLCQISRWRVKPSLIFIHRRLAFCWIRRGR